MRGTENPEISDRYGGAALSSGGGIADTPVLGTGARNGMRVQVPPRGL